ncbi:MAG: MliC family protein [Methylomonas sp.]
MFAATWLVGCATSLGQTDLAVRIGQPVRYKSPNGDVFEARYGTLSDDSLHFVKVKTPDGREYTLPQLLSASGVRYSDDRELVWWNHQDKARVETRNADGNWETKYPELREVLE